MDIRFDAARLAAEAAQFAAREWRNGALPLVAAYGDPANLEAKGPMRPTRHLARCPHAREVIESLGRVIGRARFVRERIEDRSYYALRHETVDLPFDGGHLLIDTNDGPQSYENVNLPVVMSPLEQESLLAHLQRSERVARFLGDWRALWNVHGDRGGWSEYAALRDALARDVDDERVHALLITPALNADLAQQPPGMRAGRAVYVIAPEGGGAAMLAKTLGIRAVTSVPKRAPNARFIFLYRDPFAAIASTASRDAESWAESTNRILDELEALPPERWCVASFDRIAEELPRLREFAGSKRGDAAFEPPPSPPPLDDEERARIAPIVREAQERAKELFARPPANRVRVDPAAPFRSVHTSNFAEILHALSASLIVTTYQSGRVVIVRAHDPKTLNTHLRTFNSPMGVAIGPQRIALGTRTEVWDYRNQPDVAAKLQPRPHDACFVPRNVHLTGDIRIHELAFAGGELWAVNTRFSALCTFDRDHSFVPRWSPPFITELAAEDRCHLNGMAARDGGISHVTALGETNTDNGWRENKARGGIVIDIASNEIVLRGLSMPHSPRWYGGQFFVLESGKGTLAVADLASGNVQTLAELPGFTRGLAFAGPFAFIGLSQVRESNIFGGIPLVERVQKRECGVWVVDLRTGQTVAFLRFEGSVQEIFDVQVLRGVRYPELLEPGDPLVAGTFVVPTSSSS
jgi:uncharacterized protein (TIGR03032 family)